MRNWNMHSISSLKPYENFFGRFSTKVVKEDTFKLTIGNGSVHEISKNDGVRVVNFATSKKSHSQITMFPQSD
jgi:hypothetical protein